MKRHSPFASRTALGAAAISAFAGLAFTPMVQAADWSDTSLSLRYGTAFAEPYDNNADGSRTDIKKAILALTNVTGYKYGSTFINIDFLQSNYKDPGGGVAGNPGAQEVYGVFRNTLDIGKVTGMALKMGPVRGYGVTAGIDVNTKNDGYASKKRMFVAGPTVMFEVPGFLNVSALLFDESNAPNAIARRYHYKNHAAFEADWGIGIGDLPLSFNGYAQFITAKGKDEFGAQTAPETHVDMDLMLDAGSLAGLSKKTWLVGVEYEYWRNKFGNKTATGPFLAGDGATASTPMVRVEYHF
jgi:nucleoside-specific outer membrane channel protein Tsx